MIGKYVHGKKFIGIGYLESRIINSRFYLPKYYSLVNPQQNDNQTFQQTFKSMVEDGITPSDFVLADKGPKGHKSSILVSQAGSTPIIQAPKNAAGEIVVTEKDRLFYSQHIPPEIWTILDDLSDRRTRVEQSFGFDSTTYNLFGIPRESYARSYQFVGFVNCQPLLTALTAVKTNQFHLVQSPGAFRSLGLSFQELTFADMKAFQSTPVSPCQF